MAACVSVPVSQTQATKQVSEVDFAYLCRSDQCQHLINLYYLYCGNLALLCLVLRYY
jgi:hypothetical protein